MIWRLILDKLVEHNDWKLLNTDQATLSIIDSFKYTVCISINSKTFEIDSSTFALLFYFKMCKSVKGKNECYDFRKYELIGSSIHFSIF